MTYPHLIELLLSRISTDEKIVFLDVGADNIDFFLN